MRKPMSDSLKANPRKGALAGLRVLDLGDFISGPYCTRLMADLGADVIKVEHPDGDTARRWGPFPNDTPHMEHSGLFLYVNLGKRGVTVNLYDPAGQAVIEKLLEWADVLVTNLQAKILERLSLDPASIQSRYPHLIVTTILPFGWDSPKRDHLAYPLTSFAASSVAMRVGDPERNPLVVPLSVTSYLGGVSGAGGTLAALRGKQSTGQGQHVDISEADTLTLMFANSIGAWQVTGQERNRNGRALGPFNQALYCRDGSMHVILNQQNWWEGFMDMMGNPEWGQAEEFTTPEARRSATPDTQELFEALAQAWMADYDREELFVMSRERSVNMAPYSSQPEILDMEQLKVRESLVQIETSSENPVTVPMPPYKLPQTPPHYELSAPRLGEHNVEVLCGMLHYEPSDLPVLRRLGII